MRLLIVTQKIDEQDAVLGFMHGWVLEFARQAESVSVICLEKGRVSLPENVNVFSLGKEKTELGISPPERAASVRAGNYELCKRVKYAWRFVRYIVQMRKNYDAVFVHMNPEYVVLGGLFWKLWCKTVTLWYAHKSVTPSLHFAHFLTDIVFTSTVSGFRLPSNKVKVVGQGIDTEKFKARSYRTDSDTFGQVQSEKLKVESGEFKIVTVGRITLSKDYDTLIDAVVFAQKNSNLKIHVDIVGPTSVASDEVYLKSLKEKIIQKGLNNKVVFRGPVANADLPELLGRYDLFVNMGHTGSLDKAVPEAMAVGLPVLTCNEAFKEVLGPFKGDLMYPKGDYLTLSSKILKVMELSIDERFNLGLSLRSIVEREHNLKTFVHKIISEISRYA
ncbi:MAG: glycosyltransferase family 4 protein [bacterium]|nr:glycosyltransferase family 4 protein [bacterium]